MLSLKNDAQKGETYVYLGVGINRLWLVSILVVNLYYSGCDQRNN